MGIILDIIIIGIILISTIIGYKRGLINVIFNLCAFLIALIITIVLYKPVTNFVIENTEFDDKIESVILEKGITQNGEISTENSVIDEYVSQSITNTKNDIVESTSTVIAQKVIGILVAIILFIVVRIILVFTKALFNGIASLPIIKQLNGLGGLIYGLLMGIIIVYVILAILFFIISVNNTGTLTDTINASNIAKILYSNNIILNIIF